MARLLGEHRLRGDEPAVTDRFGSTTWRELDDRANRLIDHLRRAGVEPGDRVALVAGNRREIHEVHLACVHAGWQSVPVNWHFRPDEIAHVLADSEATAVVCGSGYARMAAEALERHPDAAARSRLVMSRRPGDPSPPDGFTPYEEALAAARSDEPDDQRLGGVIFYTSGTTGKPKGVRTLAERRGAPLEITRLPGGPIDDVGIPAGGRTLLCGPHYHSAQWAFSFLPLVSGSSLVMQPRFRADAVLEAIDAHRITNVHLVPTQFIRFLRAGRAARSGFRGDSLAVVVHGAAPCPPKVKRSMIEWWGPVFAEYYGATEYGLVTTIDSAAWLQRPGSVGRPVTDVDVRILTESGTVAAPGEPGVIHVRRDADHDFVYLNDHRQTADAHVEPGFVTIGDVGYVDADGFLYLADRNVDTIRAAGARVYPAEVESVLLTHPDVVDAAVFGVPDAELGEAVQAVVELTNDRRWTPHVEAELRELCRRDLEVHQRPRSFDVVGTMPRSAAGKLLKRVLRAPYWDAAPAVTADGRPQPPIHR